MTPVVLIIDDSPDTLNWLADTIRSNTEMDVRAFAHIDEAVSFTAKNAVACVLLNERLKDESSLSVLAKLKRQAEATPVYLVNMSEERDRAASLGAAGFLCRADLSAARIARTLQNAVASGNESERTEQDAFLSVLIHDLQSPLNNMQMLGDMIAKHAASGNIENMQRALERQAEATKRASGLVQAFGQYLLADRETAFTPVDLSKVVKAAYEATAYMSVDPTVDISLGDLAPVKGNAARLTQLFGHLIKNALTYNRSDPPKIAISGEMTDKTVTVSVTDNGLGIAEKHMGMIFEPLKRLWSRADFEGTGMGLATCRKIAEAHGGRIWATSTEGSGSRFFVQLARPETLP